MIWRSCYAKLFHKNCTLPSTSYVYENSIKSFHKFSPNGEGPEETALAIKSWEIQLDSPPFSWMSKIEALSYAKVLQCFFRTEMEWKIRSRRKIWYTREIIDSIDLRWIHFKKLNEAPLILLRDKYLKFKELESVYFWVNFCYDRKRPKNLIEKLQVFHEEPSIKNNGFLKNLKKWYYYYKYSTILNEENIKAGTKQAFHTITTALQSGNMNNLFKCLLPEIIDGRISNLEGSLPVDRSLASNDYEVKNFEKLLKAISTSEIALLNVTGDDLLYMPESTSYIPFFHGKIIWDITTKIIKFKDGTMRKYLVYTVPCLAMYKKKKLYDAVGWRKLLPQGSTLPFLEVPSDYGFDRPMRVAALIQFANLFKENGTLDETVELFGFYLQVPTKKQSKKRLLNEKVF